MSSALDKARAQKRVLNEAYYAANRERLAAQRRVYREANRETLIAYGRAYYKANGEKKLASHRAYRAAHREEEQVRDRAYRLANHERMVARNRAWRLANPEKVKANRLTADPQKAASRRRAYRDAHPESTRVGNMRRRAIEAKALGSCSGQQLAGRWAMWGDRCWMCAAAATCTDHVRPLLRGGSNWPANLRPACAVCNGRKGARWPLEQAS